MADRESRCTSIFFGEKEKVSIHLEGTATINFFFFRCKKKSQ
uniref:Uncharacterized protein n=1 Tax=viral metagenome TaxID=1070528 RepID=A0A6C0K1A5_9ZZZZ